MWISRWQSLRTEMGLIRSHLTQLSKEVKHMATHAQVDKLHSDMAGLSQAIADLAVLISDHGNSDNQADPVLDQIDTDVTNATQSVKDMGSKLTPSV